MGGVPWNAQGKKLNGVLPGSRLSPVCGPHEKMVTCPTGCLSHVTLSKDVSAIKIFLQRLVERAVCPVASSSMPSPPSQRWSS